MSYTFTDHLHNYSIWTAARAVQRGWKGAKTINIKKAIESTELKDIESNLQTLNPSEFDKFHKLIAHKIINSFKSMGLKASYGRVAKIIAIYIKTSITIRDSGTSPISRLAHPPIDNILLTELDRAFPRLGLKGIKWTQLTEEKYFNIIFKLRTLNLDAFWKTEQFWHPE
jgi:uncharacterized protein YbdZ (MbtH family)